MTSVLMELALQAALATCAAPAEPISGPWAWQVPASTASDGTSSVILMGDTNIYQRTRHDVAFSDIRATLRAADIRFANLEGTFAGTNSSSASRDIPHKKRWQHSEASQIATLIDGGIDVGGVANNVAYPRDALLRSLSALHARGIKTTGGGDNLAVASRPVIVERDGTRYGFIQYTTLIFPFEHAAEEEAPGVLPLHIVTSYRAPPQLDKPGQPPLVETRIAEESRQRLIADVTALNSQADVVIVSMQWGLSNSSTVVSYQSELGRLAIDAGADVVFGHGPHRYQKVELHRGKPILHSVAQGIFDYPHNDHPEREGLLVRLVASRGKLVDVALVPTWITDSDNGKQLRMHSPRAGKGRDLFTMLQVANNGGAELVLEGDEIKIIGLALD